MDLGIIKYWKHPSKINCVFVEKRDSPLISIDIWCKAGLSFEVKDNFGTAHFLEHMIFKGSKLLKPGEFDLKIESLGGLSNASTGYDDVHYYVDIPPSNFEKALHLLTNLVFSPNFDKNEFELEKKVIIEEITENHDQKDERIFNYFLSRVWLNNPYGNSILGKEKNVIDLELRDIQIFHNKQYFPENICISIVGNLPKDYLKILENLELNYFKDNVVIKENNIKINKQIREGREIKYIEEIEFSRILMAWLLPSSRDHKSITAFEILSSILSDGRNSILNRNLKEEEQLVESIYSSLYLGEFGSLFLIEANCLEENVRKVEKKIYEALKIVLSSEELNDKINVAVQIIKSNYIFNLETSSQIAYFLGSNLLWKRNYPHLTLLENLKYWKNKRNLKEISHFFSKENFTLIINNLKK